MTDTEKLINMLRSAKAGERYDACELLRVAPDIPSEAIEALQHAANDSDATVADAARRALVVHLAPITGRKVEQDRQPASSKRDPQIERALKAYGWLWRSPLLTIPTLFVVSLLFETVVIGLVFSALWHLLLLRYVNDETSSFVRWHGRQALMLAGIRTAIPLLFVFAYGEYVLFNSAGPFLFLLAAYAIGNNWGRNQVLRGDCWLMRWRGEGADLPLTTESEKADRAGAAVTAEAMTGMSSSPVGTQEQKAALDHILMELQSDDHARQAQAIRKLSALNFSSEAVVRRLEKLALGEHAEVRAAALEALALKTSQFVAGKRSSMVKFDRQLVLGEIAKWEADGLIEPHRAETLRRRYDFDLMPATPRREAPVKAAAPARPAPVPSGAPHEAAQLETPRPAPVAAPAPVKPAAPPKPKRPPVDWKKVIAEAAASGALLRGLLYLGAFMIVVSATVLVVRFWNDFSAALQLIFIASAPLLFYAGGWFTRSRLKLEQAGGVLTGIGAALVAVDFAAIYQFGGLAGRGPLYWMIVAIFCTALYAFTAWKLRGEFFDYITLIAAASAVFAAISVARLALEWSIVSIPASSWIMTIHAGRNFKKEGMRGGLARASRYLPQVSIPASLVFLMFAPADPPIAQTVGLFFAALAYTALAWRFPTLVFAYLALAASIATVAFGVRVADLAPEWYATVAAALAFAYLLLGRGVKRLKAEETVIQSYAKALNVTAQVLIGVSVAGAAILSPPRLWSAVIALTLASLDLALCAVFFGNARYTLLAAGLFIAPFTLAVGRWLALGEADQRASWIAAALQALALAYIGLAVLIRKTKNHAGPFYLLAHILVPVAVAALSVESDTPWPNVPALAGIGLAIVAYALSFLLQDRGNQPSLAGLSNFLPTLGLGKGIFLWPAALLLPIWIATLWNGWLAWLGAALTLLGLAYIGLGQWLHKRAWEYRQPFHVFAYLLCGLGIATAIPEKYALLTALLASVASLALLATLYNRVIETVAAGLLFLWPFQLTLEILKVPVDARSLGYILLAGLAYIPLGTLLNRFEKSREKFHPTTLFVIGYALTAFAVIASLVGRASGSYIAWVGMTVPLLAAALYIFSAWYFRAAQFAFGWSWVAALTFAIAFGQSLTLFKVPAAYDALAWVGLAFAYMLIERTINITTQKSPTAWWINFRQPMVVFALGLAALGLILALPDTFSAFGGYTLKDYLPPILAQTLLVLLVIAAARLHQKNWPLFIEPFIAFLPVTLFFIGYGEKLFKQILTTPQYALVWIGLGAVHLFAGALSDRAKVRYAHGLYLGGYLLAIFALAWSWADRLTNIYTIGSAILLALFSHLLVHYGRHQTFEDFMAAFWKKADAVVQQVVSTVFLFFAVYAFPILLTQILAYNDLDLAWRGVSLALTAPLTLAIGLLTRRAKPRGALTPLPTWAMYSAAYALTAIGAMAAFEDIRLATFVLALDAVVYAASAYLFRQSFWLYLTNALVPIIGILILQQTDRLEPKWLAWTFMALAFAYFGIGRLFDRVGRIGNPPHTLNNYAAAFYFPAFLLSAVGLAYASGERMLATQIYSAGVILYALAGFIFREPLFIYPAAWLVAVPYYLAVTLTSLDVKWYGLAWLPLLLLYIALGKFVFHKRPLPPLGNGVLAQWFSHPATPFYILAYALSVSMIALSYINPLSLTLAFAAGAILYMASAFLFRTPGWIYAGLFAANMTLLASFTINPKGGEAYLLSYPFHALTWAMALSGLAFSRPRSVARPASVREEAYRFTFLERLFGHAWARPFFVFTLIDIFTWQIVALNGYETTLTLAIGHAILLTLFALLWTEGALVYGAVAFGLLAAGASLKQAEVGFADAAAAFAGIGFGLYPLALLLERLASRLHRLTVWPRPLTHSAVALTALAALVNLTTVRAEMTAAAAALGFAGALYVTIAYRERLHLPGYLGLALLEIAWTLALVMNDVAQPQFYAIPAGLYFLGVAYLELRRERKRYAAALEILGLGILLVISFMQSLGGQSFPYFVILLAEGILVIVWGTIQKRKIPFFTGIAASVINVVAQVILLVERGIVSIWYVVFGVGLLVVGIAIFIERGREQLRARSREWSDKLEKWE